jgi:parvulin-like peptidyl-prolyl isomerase
VSSKEIAIQFGEDFATRLAGLPAGEWQGPIESGYGMHLVFVSERTEGQAPELSAVRDDVRREWENARRIESNRRFYEDLLKRYTVTIEGLEPAKEPESRAGAN